MQTGQSVESLSVKYWFYVCLYVKRWECFCYTVFLQICGISNIDVVMQYCLEVTIFKDSADFPILCFDKKIDKKIDKKGQKQPVPENNISYMESCFFTVWSICL